LIFALGLLTYIGGFMTLRELKSAVLAIPGVTAVRCRTVSFSDLGRGEKTVLTITADYWDLPIQYETLDRLKNEKPNGVILHVKAPGIIG